MAESARVHLAWLMWCFEEGYRTAEDRVIMENWIALPDEALSLDDVITKENLLAMADEIIAAWRVERG